MLVRFIVDAAITIGCLEDIFDHNRPVSRVIYKGVTDSKRYDCVVTTNMSWEHIGGITHALSFLHKSNIITQDHESAKAFFRMEGLDLEKLWTRSEPLEVGRTRIEVEL